jgi:putative FmdB family regulatory protein
MPTYEYECDACGNRMEKFQRITDEPDKQCPACKKDSLRRLFGTGAAIVFKGSGFYQTDYRSPSYKSAAAKESSASGGTSETKPSSDAPTSSNPKSTSDTTLKSDQPSKKPPNKPID